MNKISKISLMVATPLVTSVIYITVLFKLVDSYTKMYEESNKIVTVSVTNSISYYTDIKTVPASLPVEKPVISSNNSILTNELLNAIIMTESNGNPNAVSYLGYNYGIGLMQVSKIGLKDYNLWNGTKYTQEDLFNPSINIKVGSWIFIHNTHYGVPKEVPALLTAYNAGVQYYKTHGIRHVYVNKVMSHLTSESMYDWSYYYS